MFVIIDNGVPVAFEDVASFAKSYKDKSDINITKIISSKKCIYLKDITNTEKVYSQDDNGLLVEFDINNDSIILINKSKTILIGKIKYIYYNITNIIDNKEYDIFIPMKN